ncbi:MAG: carboxypeptidase regulatory-like domain-containing protein [Candidatus Solibacter sp.]
MPTAHTKLARLALLLAITFTPLYSQIDRGTIQGLVNDGTGAVIPGAKVQVVRIATNSALDFITNGEGIYIAPNLPAGDYRIIVQRDGFSSFQREPVEVRPRMEARVDVTLRPGAVTESVSVTGEAPILDTATMNNASGFQEKLIHELPVIVVGTKRDITAFLNNLPGTTGTNTFSPTVNGSPVGATEAFIDGAPASERISKGTIAENGPMLETVGEVSVVTNAFNAEYGGFGNWFTNVTIKSGTNQLHGSIFDHLGNDKLNARSFFAPKRTVYRQNEGGFTLGGPLVIPGVYNGRNKTFFFGSLGVFFSRVGSAGGIITIPTQAFLRGDFSGLTNAAGVQIPIFDPDSTVPDGKGSFVRTAFTNNQIPANRISQAAKVIAGYVPATDLPGSFNNFYDHKAPTWPYFNTWTPLLKMDHSISQKQKLQGSYTYQKRPRLLWGNPGSGLGPIPKWGATQENPLDWITDQIANSWKIRLSHDYIVSPTVLNHLTFGVDRYYNLGINKTDGQGWNTKLGLTGIPADNGVFPGISFSGGTGSPVGFGRAYEENWHDLRFSVVENLSWVRGRHTLKTGFQVERDRINRNLQSNVGGSYGFSNSMTSQPNGGANYGAWGSSVASFLLGAVNTTSAYIPVVTGARYWRYGIFVQDEFRVNTKLTLSYGLRWDYDPPFTEVQDKISGFVPGLTNPGAGGRKGALGFAGSGTNGVGDNFQDGWKRGFGPRLGIAYQLNSRTVLRASSGINYANAGSGTNPPTAGFNSSPAFSSSDGYTPLYFWNKSSFPQSFVRPPSTDPSFLNGQSIVFIPRTGTRLPQTLTYTASVQRELFGNLSLEATYLGSHSTHLGFNTNYNYMPISGLSYGTLLTSAIDSPAAIAAGFTSPYPSFASQRGANTVYQSLRPYPQYTGVTTNVVSEPVGQQKFNSLQIKANKRYGKGLTLFGFMTWSKGFSRAQDQYPGDRLMQLDSYPALTYSFSWAYDLPFGKGKSLFSGSPAAVNAIVSGWKINGFLKYNSGNAMSIAAASGNLGSVGYGQRGNAVAGVSPYLVTNPREFAPGSKYLNTAAFTSSTGFNFGNLAPTLSWVRGFWGKQEALTIGRVFTIKERLQFDFSLDAVNPFNFHRWSAPNTTWNSAAFGTVTGASDGRTVQINAALKF